MSELIKTPILSGFYRSVVADNVQSLGFKGKHTIAKFLFICLTNCCLVLSSNAKYGGGSGTSEDPYLIYTAEQLNEIGADPDDWDKHFKLMADIDLAAYTGTDFNIIGYRVGWWGSIDNKPFTGVFDGNGKKITNFNYSSATEQSYIGIFGCTERARLENIYLIDPNINVERGTYVGSLVGWSQYAIITACYVQGGTVSGASEVGGLVGNNHGVVTECASLAGVSGSSAIGGLVGYNGYGSIGNCYSLGSVSGVSSVGGLVGYCSHQATIVNCYSAGRVQGTEYVGGLLGLTHEGEILSCFWDIETSGQVSSAGGIGKTTAEMKIASTFVGWGFYAAWTISEGIDYPRLRWQNMPGDMLTTASFPSIEGNGTEDNPYLIYTVEQFSAIGLFPCEWDKHFRLMADIDLSDYTGATFTTIGRYMRYPSSGYKPFSGVFDGNGQKISGFSYLGAIGNEYVGIFGYVEGGEIKNLELVDPNIDVLASPGLGALGGYFHNTTVTHCYVEGGSISGYGTVGGLVGINYEGTITNCHVACSVSGGGGAGGLVGWNRGTIADCHFSGQVLARERQAGGLVGDNSGTISNCTASANVSGAEQVGGLVGAQMGGRVIDCYTTGIVIGTDQVGGLIGGNNGIIANCYTTAEVSGKIYIGGFAGQNGLNLGDVIWSGRIFNCYATGSVQGETLVGGLVGYNDRWAGTICNCYATGSVSGVEEVGGLVGQNRKGEVINSFWDVETSAQLSSAAGVGKTTAQMKDPNTFISSGWDFVYQPDGPHDIWAEPAEGGYPILWWQLSPLPLLPTFSGGTGELNDPYLIATAEELNQFGHNPRLMKAHFKLINDIDLTGVDLFIIGNTAFPFEGVFDGNGKRIVNFRYSSIDENSYNSIDENSVGFFRCVAGGEIKDLGLIDLNIDAIGRDWLGSLICWLRGGSVTSCYAQGGRVSGSGCVGGLVAKSFNGTITDCRTAISTTGGSSVGGLVGDNTGEISNCYSTGSVFGRYTVGGLVGDNSGQIFNCYSTGNVSAANNHVGGLAGNNMLDGVITYCYAKGSVTGRHTIGGLVGYNRGVSAFAAISNCYATGSVEGIDNVGGLVALNWIGVITNCFSISCTSGSDNVGGLVGCLGPGEISHCYSIGRLWGAEDTGGLVGYIYESEAGLVKGSFWDIQTSGQTTSDGGTGKTTAEMQLASTFLNAGWDFVGETANGTEDIWCICEGVDYPKLTWQFSIGDFDNDGDTDFVDFCILAERWISTDDSFWCGRLGRDLTNDGWIDIVDLRFFARNWLTGGQ